MTLHLTLFADDYLILVSDRRLSNNGKVMTDEHNRATVLDFDDARLVCGFTGIATVTMDNRTIFNLQDWLLDALFESASPDFASIPTLQRLRKKCSLLFRDNARFSYLKTAKRKLAIYDQPKCQCCHH
jgi:hypothetical protein